MLSSIDAKNKSEEMLIYIYIYIYILNRSESNVPLPSIGMASSRYLHTHPINICSDKERNDGGGDEAKMAFLQFFSANRGAFSKRFEVNDVK